MTITSQLIGRKEAQIAIVSVCAIVAVAYWRSRDRATTTSSSPKTKTKTKSKSKSKDGLKSLLDMPVVVADERRWRTENHHYLDELFRAHGDMIFVKRARECDSQIWTRDPEAFRNLTLGARVWGSRDWSVEGRVANVSNLIQPMYQNTFFYYDGDKWKQRRRVMNPLFSVRHEFIDAVLFETAQYMREIPEGIVDLTQHMHVLFQKIVFRIGAGEAGPGMNEAQLARHARVVDYFTKRYLDGTKDFSVTKQDFDVFELTRLVAMDLLREIKPRIAAGEDARQFGMIGAMVSASRVKYDDAEICETFANLMVAAAESPAVSTAYTLMEMVKHPKVMQQLRQEIAANVPAQVHAAAAAAAGDSGDSTSAKQWLLRLSYTQACIEEGLRMFVPATIVSRQAVSDTTLAGYRMPKGTVVGGCMYSLHFDERYWPQPHEFVPERHLKDSPLRATMAPSSKGSFAPFSFGAKKCPGGPITLTMAKVVILFLLRQFELSPAPLPQESRVQKFVACHAEGTPVRLKRRLPVSDEASKEDIGQ